MPPFLLDIDYRGDERVFLRLVGREKGRLVLVEDKKFLPYFYVEAPKEELERAEIGGKGPERLERVELLLGKEKLEVVKLFLRHPREVPVWREELPYRKWETSIPFVRRYMIDKKLLPLSAFQADGGVKRVEGSMENPRILAFDIETHAPMGMPRKKKDPAIMVSLFGEGLEKVLTWRGDNSPGVDVHEDEKAMLEAFVEEVERFDPDILTGYNTDNFDLPYLRARCEENGVKLGLGFQGEEVSFVRRGAGSAAKVFGRVHVDLYPFVRNILSRSLMSETLDLDAVANELVGEGKREIDWEKVQEMWEKGESGEMAEYCLQDGKVTFLLAKKLVPMILEISRATGTPAFDVARMSTSQIVEYFLISKAHGERLVPQRPAYHQRSSRRRAKFEGAFVVEPKRGLHENIALADFRSLYPSIIVSHNISPETLDCDCCGERLETGHWFCEKRKGFIPSALKELLEKRIELKKRLKGMEKNSSSYRLADAKQKALKLIINSMYGYLGFSGARWYSFEAARATTALGRRYIKETIEKARKRGFSVIYGDTDSVFLTAEGGDFKKKVKAFVEEINDGLPGAMELELDGIYKRGVFVTKKRYALLDFENRLVVKGLERVRRDWAPVAKETQEKVLRSVLESGDVEEAVEMARKKVEEIKEGIPIEKVTILSQLTRNIEDYKQVGPHVAAAKKMRERGEKVRAGVLIPYVITPGRGSISERAEPAGDAKEYDPDYYINNQVMPAVLRVLEAFGYDKDKLLKGQSKLHGWL